MGSSAVTTGCVNTVRLGLAVPLHFPGLEIYLYQCICVRIDLSVEKLTTAVAVPAPRETQLRTNVRTPNTMILKTHMDTLNAPSLHTHLFKSSIIIF